MAIKSCLNISLVWYHPIISCQGKLVWTRDWEYLNKDIITNAKFELEPQWETYY